MILELSREAFVASHVVSSLVALLSGRSVARHLFAARTPAGRFHPELHPPGVLRSI